MAPQLEPTNLADRDEAVGMVIEIEALLRQKLGRRLIRHRSSPYDCVLLDRVALTENQSESENFAWISIALWDGLDIGQGVPVLLLKTKLQNVEPLRKLPGHKLLRLLEVLQQSTSIIEEVCQAFICVNNFDRTPAWERTEQMKEATESTPPFLAPNAKICLRLRQWMEICQNHSEGGPDKAVSVRSF